MSFGLTWFIGWPVLFVFSVYCMIKASMKANVGQVYQYPLTIHFIGE